MNDLSSLKSKEESLRMVSKILREKTKLEGDLFTYKQRLLELYSEILQSSSSDLINAKKIEAMNKIILFKLCFLDKESIHLVKEKYEKIKDKINEKNKKLKSKKER